MIDEDICTRAMAYTDLTALIGDRFWPLKFPDNYLVTDPVVVFQLISDVPQTSVDGPIILREARYQFSVYANNRPDAFSVADALIACFHRYAGGSIKRMSFAGRNEIYEDDTSLHHIPVDFFVRF